MSNENTTIQVTCPCCDATLTIDPMLSAVLDYRTPVRPQMAVELKDAARMVKEEAGRAVGHDLERYLTTLGTIAAVAPRLFLKL